MLIARLALAILSGYADAPALFRSLEGAWVGYLEYQDYASPKRIKLATMLRVTPSGDGASAAMRFVYDEGPKSILEDTQTVRLDPGQNTYTVESAGKQTAYRVEGLSAFTPGKGGRLLLHGQGASNDKPVDVRLTLTVRPDSLTMLRETRLPGKPFVFGSIFKFSRVN